MNGVKLQSLDLLLCLRAGVWKFVELAQRVLSDVECELQRTQNWLETEAVVHWRGEIRKRQQEIERAKAALRAKKMFKSDLSQRSVVDEEKALRQAQARLREAERTLEAVQRYRQVLQKEIDQYRGQVARLSGSVSIDLPMAAAKLDALLGHLRDYLRVKPAEYAAAETAAQAAWGESVSGEDLPSMARGTADEDDKGTRAPEDREIRGSGDQETAAENRKSEIPNPQSEAAHGSL